MEFSRSIHRGRAWTSGAVLRASEPTCDNKCQKKPARGVLKQAATIFTYGSVVENLEDFMRGQVLHLRACRIRCARACMDFKRCVEDAELRRLRVDNNDALEALQIQHIPKVDFTSYTCLFLSSRVGDVSKEPTACH